MATVRKRTWGDGKEAWQVSYSVDRKRHTEAFQSKKAADARRREIEHELDMGLHVAKGESVIFSDAYDAWMLDCQRRKLGRNTLNSYRRKIEKYALPYLGGRLLTDLHKHNRDFRQWIDDLKDAGLKASTIRGAFQTVLGIQAFAVDHGWIKRNILRDQPLNNLPKLSKRAKVPDTEKVLALINACEQQVRSENLLTFLNRRVCVWLGVTTGMRPGEWFGLQWEDLDFEQNTININHAFNPYDLLKAPKSEAGKRANTISPPLYAALNDLALYWTYHDRMCGPGYRSYNRKTITLRIQDAWARRHDEQIDIPPRTGFVILSKSKQPMRTNSCVNFWGKLMKKAGLREADGKNPFTQHALRHFHVSYRLQNGEPILHISKDVGHARGSTTLDVYGHCLPGDESARQGVMQMGERFAPKLLTPPNQPEDNRERKLTEDQVREIRVRIANGEALQRIGREMGVGLGAVQSIKSGRNWSWLA